MDVERLPGSLHYVTAKSAVTPVGMTEGEKKIQDPGLSTEPGRSKL